MFTTRSVWAYVRPSPWPASPYPLWSVRTLAVGSEGDAARPGGSGPANRPGACRWRHPRRGACPRPSCRRPCDRRGCSAAVVSFESKNRPRNQSSGRGTSGARPPAGPPGRHRGHRRRSGPARSDPFQGEEQAECRIDVACGRPPRRRASGPRRGTHRLLLGIALGDGAGGLLGLSRLGRLGLARAAASCSWSARPDPSPAPRPPPGPRPRCGRGPPPAISRRPRRSRGSPGGRPPRRGPPPPAAASPISRPAPGADGRPGRDRLAAQPALQVVGQRLGRAVAPLRVLLQALQADRLQVAVDRRVERPRAAPAPAPAPAAACPAASRPGTAAGRSAARRGSRPGCRRRPRWSAPSRRAACSGGHVAGRADDGAGLRQARCRPRRAWPGRSR